MIKRATIMGMPVVIHIVDKNASEKDFREVFDYLRYIDETFSTYKKTSEISKINSGKLQRKNVSQEVKRIFSLCEVTKQQTHGYFDMERNGIIDPSGIVKGYAIHEGANILRKKGYKNFSFEIAGDIEIVGKNEKGKKWKIGIQNPFNAKEIIKVIHVSNKGVATSGNYLQKTHIYNPLKNLIADEIVSMTVIGPNAYEADRFATAAFAMGEKGIQFIEDLSGFEGYMVTKEKKAYMTSKFENFL